MSKFLLAFVVIALIVIGLQSAAAGTAVAAGLPQNVRSIDVMKFTKDRMANQPADAQIENIVSALAAAHVNYIAISIPMDASADYPAASKPAPRDAYAITQKWADVIHAHGLGVIWRGTWSGIEGIYGFTKLVGPNRFPAGTAASAATDGNSSWLGKTYQYIVSNPNFFKAGDVWAPLPERTEGIFSDSTSFLPYTGAGIQANYTNFSMDLKTVSDQAFAKIGKSVATGMTANNYTEVKSTWLPQSLFDATGIIAIDYYGYTHTASEMDSDLRAMYNLRHKPIFLQEWGDYWNSSMTQADRTSYLNSIYSVLQKLQADGILAGFNYWGGWDNNAEGLLTATSSGYQLNYRGRLLSNFFAGGAPTTAALTTTTTTTASTTTVAPSTVTSPTTISAAPVISAATQTTQSSTANIWQRGYDKIRSLFTRKH